MRGVPQADWQDFLSYKRSLIAQGRSFCSVTAPQCRDKIAKQAVDFLRDDCVVSFPLPADMPGHS